MSEKNYENLSDHELLVELLKSQKRDTRNEKVSAIANVVLCVLLIITMAVMIPRTITILDQAGIAMTELEETVSSAQSSLKKIDSLVSNADTLVESNMDAMSESLQKLSEVDLDNLNSSIQSLSTVLEPLATLIGRLSR